MEDTRIQAWVCEKTLGHAQSLIGGLVHRLRTHWYKKRPGGDVQGECRDPESLMVWAMATKTEGFRADKLSTASQDSLGVQFLSEAITASIRLHEHRAQEREQALRSEFRTTLTLKQYMRLTFRR